MDFSYLISISDGDKAFVQQFIATFQSNSLKLVGQMRESFAAQDLAKLKAHAHQLKPSLEMLKLEAHATCVSIQHNPAQAEESTIDSIETEILSAVQALKNEFNL